MMSRRYLAAGLVILLGVGMASAQPGGPGGPGGRGPGLGMRPGSPAALLGIPEVRKELGTSESQNKQIDETLTALSEQMRGGFNFEEFQRLTPEERQKFFEESRKKTEEAVKKGEEKLFKLLDAKQTTRLEQLRLQSEGLAAFGRQDVVKKLGLTEDQQAKIGKIQGEGPGWSRDPERRKKDLADAVAALTADQKTKWADLTGKEFQFPAPRGGPGGPGGFPGGPGGFPGGPMGGQERKLVERFDKDSDGRLNNDERKAARETIKKEGGGGRGPGGRGPGGGFPGGPGGGRPEPKPGPQVKPQDVKTYPDARLYEPTVLRTLFLEFENKDWEAELSDFHNSDVEVPVTLTVDGKKYPNVGVHFRGMSSYGMVGAGSKRSLNLSMDFADPKQRLHGYKTLNLLNCNGDPSMMSSVLYSHIARQHMPAPQANFVKVVINGESWGVYANVQQFNKEFLSENFKSTKGARWKVPGRPNGDSGLNYTSDNVEDYKRRYEMKDGNDKDWKALIELCRTLSKTPPEKLEEALKPILDVDSLLWFLALDVALINSDGYWTRASDYSIYRDGKGVFHILPHDMNEAFHGAMMGFGPGGGFPGGPGGGRPGGGRPGGGGPGAERPGPGGPGGGRPGPGGPGGPGGGGMRRGSGFELDPLVGLDDARKPLRSKVLAVPAFRARYLANVRTIAEKSLDWKNLGPVVKQYRDLIEKEIEADTRKLATTDAFKRATEDSTSTDGRGSGLRAFAEQRRKYLLDHPEIKKLPPDGKLQSQK